MPRQRVFPSEPETPPYDPKIHHCFPRAGPQLSKPAGAILLLPEYEANPNHRYPVNRYSVIASQVMRGSKDIVQLADPYKVFGSNRSMPLM